MTISRTNGYSLRHLAKSIFEGIASQLPSKVSRNASLVLAYHNIVPDTGAGRGDASLHMPLRTFREQLSVISAEADMVDLPTLLRDHGRPGRRIAVTFDDAYAGCLHHGVPACRDFGVVPTIFVTPQLGGRFPVWDILSEEGRWAPADRQRFLVADQGRHRESPYDDLLLPKEYIIASLTELRTAMAIYPFHVGNHTLSHANLSVLSSDVVLAEVAGGGALLAEFGDSLLPVVAYPYGLAPDPDTRRQLSTLCHAAFCVEGGWMEDGVSLDQFALPRLNIPAGLSAVALRAHIRGHLYGSVR